MRRVSQHGGDVFFNKVDLDFSINTNFLPTPTEILDSAAIGLANLEEYPDIEQTLFRASVAILEGVQPSQTYGGAGASELLTGIARAIAPRKALLVEPCFSGYRRALVGVGCRVVAYDLSPEKAFLLDEDLLQYITPDLDAFFIANPNNPTGRNVPRELMLKILNRCERYGIALVVDESFLRLSSRGFSVAKYIDEYKRLYVVNSFTKIFAIPGLRIGYVVSRQENILRISRQLPEWNMSTSAQIAGGMCVAVLRETDFVERARKEIERERVVLTQGLRDSGVLPFPSESNFILTFALAELYTSSLKKRILVRSCENFRGLGASYIRVAVRAKKENDVLLERFTEEIEERGWNAVDPSNIFLVKRMMDQCRPNPEGSVNLASDKRTDSGLVVVAPNEIEELSMSTIENELKEMGVELPTDKAFLIKRAIHTTADFEYAETLRFSEGAIPELARLFRAGADVVTDTNMALSGINKTELSKYGGQVRCFMADEDVAAEAKARGVTRAVVSMERAATLGKPVVFAIGNAPTALARLYESVKNNEFRPAFIIGAPVGFVNVERSKELVMELDVPYIVNKGRKGGSPVVAAICNAVLYEMKKGAL